MTLSSILRLSSQGQRGPDTYQMVNWWTRADRWVCTAALTCIMPCKPSILTDFFASRAVNGTISCDDFFANESPQVCIPALCLGVCHGSSRVTFEFQVFTSTELLSWQ